MTLLMEVKTSSGMSLGENQATSDRTKAFLQERTMRSPLSSLFVTLWAVTKKLRGCQEESKVMCISDSL